MKTTKEEIARRIANEHSLTLQNSLHHVELLLEIIKRNFENNDDLLISRFGKFKVKRKKERKGRNPQTGDTIILEPRNVITFSPSHILRKEMNKDEKKEKKTKSRRIK